MQAAVLEPRGAALGRFGVPVSNHMGASDSFLTGGQRVPGLAVRCYPREFAVGEPVLTIRQNLAGKLAETVLLGQQTGRGVFHEPNFGVELVDELERAAGNSQSCCKVPGA